MIEERETRETVDAPGLRLKTLEVSLPLDLANYLEEKTVRGGYGAASMVVQDALRRLQEEDHLRERRKEALMRELEIGLDELDRGEGAVYDEEGLKEMFARLKAEAARHHREHHRERAEHHRLQAEQSLERFK